MTLQVTLFDEYGRCLHCGFWHSDLASSAALSCAEHEHGGKCLCALNRQFFPLPAPHRMRDGSFSVDPAVIERDMLLPLEPHVWTREHDSADRRLGPDAPAVQPGRQGRPGLYGWLAGAYLRLVERRGHA